MKRASFFLLASILLFPLTGCMNRFTPMTSEQLSLGKDTLQQIRGRLGAPQQEATLIKYGKTMHALTYTYSSPSLKAGFGGPMVIRTQVFYFFNNTLAGYVYNSTGSDSTAFDTKKVEKIKEGQSRIEEVTSLLGSPSGEYIYPMIEKEDQKGKVYIYVQFKTQLLKTSIYEEILVICYDKSGLVTKVDFTEIGNK